MSVVPPSSPIYGIPGLGTDTRVFSRLQKICPLGIEWLEPFPKEKLSDYAVRMAEYITQPNPTLIGVSFGGILAQEIAQLIPVRKIILISSIKAAEELPQRLQLMRTLPLYQLSRGSWRIRTLPYWGKLFGIHDPKELLLIQDMFRKHSDTYRMWAIKELVNWRPPSPTTSLIHIHGTSDRVFPIQRIQDCIRIRNGDHFMVYRRAREVEEILETCLV
ncbi:MAG: alpha/beta hydrolase [Bacteroidota bacterium]